MDSAHWLEVMEVDVVVTVMTMLVLIVFGTVRGAVACPL